MRISVGTVFQKDDNRIWTVTSVDLVQNPITEEWDVDVTFFNGDQVVTLSQKAAIALLSSGYKIHESSVMVFEKDLT